MTIVKFLTTKLYDYLGEKISNKVMLKGWLQVGNRLHILVFILSEFLKAKRLSYLPNACVYIFFKMDQNPYQAYLILYGDFN